MPGGPSPLARDGRSEASLPRPGAAHTSAEVLFHRAVSAFVNLGPVY